MAEKVWNFQSYGYKVEKNKNDGDLHDYQIIKDGQSIGRIVPCNLEDDAIIAIDLDTYERLNEDINGWADGMGNTIDTNQRIDVKEEHIRIVLQDLSYRDEDLVNEWLFNDTIIKGLKMNYHEAIRYADHEYIPLVQFLDHEIQNEQLKRSGKSETGIS